MMGSEELYQEDWSQHPLPPPPRPSRSVWVRQILSRKNRLHLIALIIILLFAAFLRMHNNEVVSLNIDEGYYFNFVTHTPLKYYLSGHVEGHPPTYEIFLRVWLLLIGEGIGSARTFSAMAGVLCVALTAGIAGVLFGRNTAILAGLLVMISPLHIHHSHLVRRYAFFSLVSLLSFITFLLVLERGTPLRLGAYTVMSAVGLYTHLFFFYALMAHAVAFLLFIPRKHEKMMNIIALASSGLLFLPYVIAVLLAEWGAMDRRAYVPFNMRMLKLILLELFGLFRKDMIPLLLAVICLGILLALIMTGLFIAMLRAHHSQRRYLQVLALFVLCPPVFMKICEMCIGPILPYGMNSKQLLFLFPVLAILLAQAALNLGRQSRVLQIALLLLLLFPPAISLYALQRDSGSFMLQSSVNWKAMAEYLSSHHFPGDEVVLYPHQAFYPLSAYLSESWPSTYGDAVSHGRGVVGINSAEIHSGIHLLLPDCFVLVTSPQHVWVDDPEGIFMAQLEKEYVSIERRYFRGGYIGKYIENKEV